MLTFQSVDGIFLRINSLDVHLTQIYKKSLDNLFAHWVTFLRYLWIDIFHLFFTQEMKTRRKKTYEKRKDQKYLLSYVKPSLDVGSSLILYC